MINDYFPKNIKLFSYEQMWRDDDVEEMRAFCSNSSERFIIVDENREKKVLILNERLIKKFLVTMQLFSEIRVFKSTAYLSKILNISNFVHAKLFCYNFHQKLVTKSSSEIAFVTVRNFLTPSLYLYASGEVFVTLF